GRVTGIMIVVEAIHSEVTCQELPHDGHPGPGVLGSVDHEVIPRLRNRLHRLPVAEPTDIGEISGHHVMLAKQLLNRGHPWMVGECKGHAVRAQQVEQALGNPPAVAQLYGKAEPLRELIEDRLETIQERLRSRKLTLREVGKLEE